MHSEETVVQGEGCKGKQKERCSYNMIITKTKLRQHLTFNLDSIQVQAEVNDLIIMYLLSLV